MSLNVLFYLLALGLMVVHAVRPAMPLWPSVLVLIVVGLMGAYR